MSVFSVIPKEGNPVTTAVLDDVCKALGVIIKNDEKEDYRRLLAVFHESAEELMAMPDFEPQVDLERFPRKQVRFPEAKDNPHGAWAWRCSIKDPSINGGSLSGRKIAIKDNIAVKDVPMLMGTDFVKGFIPVGIWLVLNLS
jgi:amidase